MGSLKSSDIWRIIVGLLIVFICLFFCGGIMVIGEQTLVNILIPIFIGIAAGAIAGSVLWRLWRWLTGTSLFLPNFLLSLVVTAIVVAFGILMVNRLRTRGDHKETAIVEKVYWKQHYRSYRNGRRGYRRGAPYKTYHVRMKLARGLERNFEIPHGAYLYYHRGDTVGLDISKGCLGMDIIGDSFKKVKGKSPRRCKSVYSTRGRKGLRYPSAKKDTASKADEFGRRRPAAGD